MPVAVGEKEPEGVTVTVTPLEEIDCRKTWGNDVARERRKSWSWNWTWGLRLGWASFRNTTEQTADFVIPTTKSALNTTHEFVRDDISTAKKYRFSMKQCFGILLLSVGGAFPLVLFGHYGKGQNRDWFGGVFEPKIVWCGNNYVGIPQDSRIFGIEGFFVLDHTYGQLSFSRAKTIDVVWDILVARGVQALAWWVTYVVFSDALLRVIERHPTSFEIFQRIALEGPSLHSLWTLFKGLWTGRSKRTKALFCYMLLATSYVLCIPVFMGAMTGYDSNTSSWIDPGGNDNLIPTDSLRAGWVVWGNGSLLFDEPVCAEEDDFSIYMNQFKYQARNYEGDCRKPDGTVLPPNASYYNHYDYISEDESIEDSRKSCRFDYPGASKTYNLTDWYGPDGIQYCNATKNVKVNGVVYDAQNLNGTGGWCYKNTGWKGQDISNRSKCLPDTANLTYGWGFSTMLSGLFVAIHFAWSVSMYIVWQHAQATSVLVQSGYNMTPLRAAFAMAKAAKHRTGLGEGRLVRADTKDLEKELYGHRSTRGTNVDYNLFIETIEDAEDGRMGIRRRAVRGRDEMGLQRTLANANPRFDEK